MSLDLFFSFVNAFTYETSGTYYNGEDGVSSSPICIYIFYPHLE